MMSKLIVTLIFAVLVSGCSATKVAQAKSAKSVTLVALQQQRLMPVFNEISGLAMTDNRYWAINDSGGEAALYGFDKDDPKRFNVVKIRNASNFDWEDLAQDQQYIYIADSGDNFAIRPSINIYKVEKSALNLLTTNSWLESQRLRIQYTDKDNILPQKKHNFDSEALSVVNDKLWLFSKNRADGNTKLYIIDKNLSDQQVAPSAIFAVDGLITAADYRPSTGKLLLLGYSRRSVFGHSFIWVVDVQADKLVWSSAERYIIKPYAQWESIQWTSDAGFVIGAENSALGKQQIAGFKLP